MTLPLAGLVAAYVVIAVLLLSLNLTSRWRWWIKAGAILATAAFFAVTPRSIGGLIGWPSDQPLPANFQLHWATVTEPDKATHEDGAIFLWVEELDANNVPMGVPRAHRLPYTDALAGEVEGAMEQIQGGEEVAGSAEMVEDQQAEGEQVEEGEEAGDNAGSQEQQAQEGEGALGRADASVFEMDESLHIQFSDMPTPDLPSKGEM